MNKGRLEAFSDGVLAIIITIMVLEIKVPEGGDFASLKSLFPVFISYVLSFIYIGIYWNSHHHILHGVTKVNGKIQWANLHLLFWMSLVPFTTGWMGENHFSSATLALYGFSLLMSGIAYVILQNVIVANEGENSLIKKAIGKGYKGKLSIILYTLGIIFSFYIRWVSGAIYILVALMWFIPDRRIEKVLAENKD